MKNEIYRVELVFKSRNLDCYKVLASNFKYICVVNYIRKLLPNVWA